ncbi:MAG: 16S rRNA processing protein RimM [Bacteroidetes bacterium]|nr:16S rRNA processing protein RimM [Bacteroidota bacterium]
MRNLIPICTISKIHGFKGYVKADCDFSNIDIKIGKHVFIAINNKPVPFFIEDIKGNNDELLIKFDDINSPEEAEELVGLNILSDSENKLNGLGNFRKIEGYKLIDQNMQFAGVVLSLINRPGQDLLEIEFEKNIYFLPCVSQIILKINHKEKTIFTEIPEGLISLNN